MKIPPPSFKPCQPNPASPFTSTDIGSEKPAAMSLRAVEEEKFLPFGKAAKDIFVKANGLSAYYRSAGSLQGCTGLNH